MKEPVFDVGEAATQLRAWLAGFRRVFVLTGAGCSTASGIPDYRDAHGEWKRAAPVNYRDFVDDGLINASYWARSLVGWPVISSARPSMAHLALADWQRHTESCPLVTQNVDGLHESAGSHGVIDLHGRIDRVVCLQCAVIYPRSEIQRRLVEDNPAWSGLTAATAPDGDAGLEGHDFSRFRVPACTACNGMLKPDVVFFGENVPRVRYENACAALESCEAMLVVGSSLMVYSGFRFARMAYDVGKPIAILNRGVTRADSLAALKLDADCGTTLQRGLA